MRPYDEEPEGAEESIRKATDELQEIDNAISMADSLSRSFEDEWKDALEFGDQEAADAAWQRHHDTEMDLYALQEDRDAAEARLISVINSWGL